MDELVRWLGEQLDEEAELAASGESWSMFPEGDFGTPRVDVDHSIERVVACTRAWRAKHIARHDPARVLREIEAKRQLVKLHGRATLRAGGGAQYFDTTTVCRSCEANYQFPELSWPCTTLRLLALPYADRPGYREEWRP